MVAASAAREPREIHASCQDSPEPAIIIPNMIVGGLIAWQALSFASGEVPLSGILRYDTFHKGRIFVQRPIITNCGRCAA